ncbi:MAG: hypothetical protein IT342_21830 [Candidatus Melainabacteria bacterium]|nr:hypothetical protein [Candidatus Melainabacteria bacterium]
MVQKLSNAAFNMTFVSNTRGSGVIAKERVHGRIAFPSSGGPQPNAGETWRVTIACENPKRTVYFLSCIEKAETGTGEKGAVANGTDEKGNMESPLPASAAQQPLDGAAPVIILTDGPRYPSSQMDAAGQTLLAKVEPDRLIGNAITRTKMWLTPVVKITLRNLSFARMQQRAAADPAARATAAAMAMALQQIEDMAKSTSTLNAQVKRVAYPDQYAVAVELFEARKQVQWSAETKRQLNLQTLAYGRLVQKVKRAGNDAEEILRVELAQLKQKLDAFRKSTNEQCKASSSRLADAEQERRWCCYEDVIDEAVAILEEIDKAETMRAEKGAELAALVESYTARVQELQNAA